MCNKMYQCRNCTATSETLTAQCTKCGMKGALVEVQTAATEATTKVKQIFQSCKNCGTTEMGNEAKCQVCHFPVKRESLTSTLELSPKVKTS